MNNFKIETGTLTFSNTDTGTITFSLNYKSSPIIVASPDDDINIHVESVSTSAAVIRTSAIYSGNIQYQVIANY